MAKQKKKIRKMKPLVEAFSFLPAGTVNAVAFHEAIADSSAMVRVKYTLTTTPGLAVEKVAFGNKAVDLENDQDPADPNVFKTQGRKFDEVTSVDNQLLIDVIGNGLAGNGWSLEVTVEGKALPDNPIKKKVDQNGNANHKNVHDLP